MRTEHREAAMKEWMLRWPDTLHEEHKYDPAYIAQREAFIDGYIAAIIAHCD